MSGRGLAMMAIPWRDVQEQLFSIGSARPPDLKAILVMF
jgi:hypothetical protein